MRRSLCLLALLATAAAGPLAFAQSSQPQLATDAGAPTAATPSTSTSTATPPPAHTPTRASTSTSTPAPTPATHAVTEQEVYQLGRLVELEAERARGRRYVGSTIELVTAGGVIAGGALLFTVDTTGVDPSLVTLLQITGGVEVGFGVVMAVDSVISYFVESPMEKMFDTYAPIAIDKSLTPAERLHRGEAMLESMAERERAARIMGVAGGLIAGALYAGIGIWIVADNNFWGNDPTSTAYRPLLGTLLGLSVASMIGDAIAKMLWDRGPAELAWEHWHVSHEPASVQTSRLRLDPIVAPIPGGMMGGLSARF